MSHEDYDRFRLLLGPRIAAMRLAAGLEAMITDHVDLVSRGEIEPSSNVLYAHLGGQPAINGYAGLVTYPEGHRSIDRILTQTGWF